MKNRDKQFGDMEQCFENNLQYMMLAVISTTYVIAKKT